MHTDKDDIPGDYKDHVVDDVESFLRNCGTNVPGEHGVKSDIPLERQQVDDYFTSIFNTYGYIKAGDRIAKWLSGEINTALDGISMPVLTRQFQEYLSGKERFEVVVQMIRTYRLLPYATDEDFFGELLLGLSDIITDYHNYLERDEVDNLLDGLLSGHQNALEVDESSSRDHIAHDLFLLMGLYVLDARIGYESVVRSLSDPEIDLAEESKIRSDLIELNNYIEMINLYRVMLDHAAEDGLSVPSLWLDFENKDLVGKVVKSRKIVEEVLCEMGEVLKLQSCNAVGRARALLKGTDRTMRLLNTRKTDPYEAVKSLRKSGFMLLRNECNDQKTRVESDALARYLIDSLAIVSLRAIKFAYVFKTDLVNQEHDLRRELELTRVCPTYLLQALKLHLAAAYLECERRERDAKLIYSQQPFSYVHHVIDSYGRVGRVWEIYECALELEREYRS
ncbi:hypothetical protein A2982_00270 [candidate division WWE3 bacterium RIFCSPLOWO2_01_FULL_39_13]|uniref:Uncharacterized protein n=1 Tax=candidate division WWE3 bacterium RIFCSPLOWO2_01_FULL_39_13 TaxID=1802624 RepID=A0A1F4V4F3_UNCKA|nr:MAG: hypothetical protein A2982_00270 [candidate division WWE3 bacterium RIFCSPLOWO2_01_FULL_39_13]